jgi:hypothetical protein
MDGSGEQGARSSKQGAVPGRESRAQPDELQIDFGELSRAADFGLRIGGSRESRDESQGTLTLALSQRERGFHDDALAAWVASWQDRYGARNDMSIESSDWREVDEEVSPGALLDSVFEMLSAETI